MRNYLLYMFLLLASQAIAQEGKKFWIGPKVGVHLTQLIGRSVGTSRVNAHSNAGISTEYRFNSTLVLSADISYNRLGGSYGSVDTSAAYKDFKLAMWFDYIHLPLLLRLHPQRSPFFLEAGGQVGYFLSRQIKINDLNAHTQPTEPVDAGWVVGTGHHITKHLCVNFRYYRGLTPIYQPSSYTNPQTGQVTRFPVVKIVHQYFGLQAAYYF